MTRHVVKRAKRQRQIATKKSRFRERQAGAGIIRPGRDIQRKGLPSPKEIAFRKANVQTDSGLNPIACAKGQRPSRLFFDVHIDDDLIRSRALLSVDLSVREKAECPDAFGGLANFARVKGIALGAAEFPAHNAVQRGRVALDINAFNKNTWAAHQRKLNIQGAVAVIAGYTWIDAHKIQPLAERQIFHPRDGILNHCRGIGHARADA